MRATKVKYTVQSVYAKRNAENINDVVNEIKRLNTADIKYCTFLLDDKKSFVHFVMLKNEEANHILTNLESFKKFRSELKDSNPEISPMVENISLVCSSFTIF